MYINLDGLEIMVKVRREELIEQSSMAAMSKRRSSTAWARRALIRVGGLLVTAGMALERLGLDREIYHLSTTISQ
jgi:hypothetical protein